MLVCTNLIGVNEILFPSSVEQRDEIPVVQSVEVLNKTDAFRILSVLSTSTLQNVAFRAYLHNHLGSSGSCSRSFLTNSSGLFTTNLSSYVSFIEPNPLEGDLPRVVCLRSASPISVSKLTNSVLPLLFQGTNGKPRQVNITTNRLVSIF